MYIKFSYISRGVTQKHFSGGVISHSVLSLQSFNAILQSEKLQTMFLDLKNQGDLFHILMVND